MTLAEWFIEHPQIFKEWDSEVNTHITPETEGYAISKKAWWVCEKGHRYESRVRSRTYFGQGCPYCAGQRVLAGYNDLATTNPNVLMRWDYEKNTDFSPTEITEFSHKKAWWKCEKGHSWYARVQSVTTKEKNTGCPYCGSRILLKGFNDLATLYPDVAKEWSYELNEVTPDEVMSKNNNKFWWKCEKGHTWQASPSSRTGVNKTKCPYCTNKKVWPGFNDLATVDPEVAAEWCYELNGDLKPTEVLKGTAREVWWKCSEGHVWQAQIRNRTGKKRSGCAHCAAIARHRK